MNATKPTTTPTPTQGHTPKPWMAWPFGQECTGDDVKIQITKTDYERARLCVNVCTGLTTEQVEAIPAKLTAFNVMQKALIDIIPYAKEEIRALHHDANKDRSKIPEAEMGHMRLRKARAALKLADACESKP